MAIVRRRPCSFRIQGFAAPPGAPWSWAAAALSFVFLALTGDEAPAQSGGCARCGAPANLPATLSVPTLRPKTAFVERTRRTERWTLRTSIHVSPQRTADYTVCVRKCDGSFFPVSYFGADSRSDTLEQVCRSLCPNADVALYSFPFGGTVEEAVSSAGEPYGSLPNAGRFEQTNDPTCSCRASGQSWAETLGAAEAKYGRHSRDVLISVEAAERMSRPVPAAAYPAQARAEPLGGLSLGLDANGVDVSLSAAAAAISRGGSGIHDEDGQRITSYGVKQGQTVEETIPDGSVRRVRILPSNF